MILQALHQLYGRLEQDKVSGLPKPNHSLQDISYKVVLSEDGASYQIQDIRASITKKSRNGKETNSLEPITLPLPGDARASERSYTPCVLWDDTRFLFGWHGKQDDQTNNLRCFEAFKAFHLDREKEIASSAFSAVCTFLRKWKPQDAYIDPVLAAIKLGRGVFQIQAKTCYVHDDPAFTRWWAANSSSDEDGMLGQCLVTGEENVPIAQIHPGIFDIPKVPYTGGSLVSFNENAYESYGKEGKQNGQGYNAPVSKIAAFRYSAALNWLLASNRQKLRIGDSTAVFWTAEPTPAEQLLPFLLDSSNPPQDPALISMLEAALENIASGRPSPATFGDSATRYFILGLVVNNGRLSVRFWHTSTLGDLAGNLQRHHHDLATERQWDETNSTHPEPKAPGIYALLRQTARDADGIPPILGGALIRAILLGTNYPDALFQKVMSRVRVAEKDPKGNALDRVSYLRAAIIKACLNRNHKQWLNQHQCTMNEALDKTIPHVAYQLGRLFAVYEKAQRAAHGYKLDRTIRETMFSAASATPLAVFGRLDRLHKHHLAKLSKGSSKFYGDIVDEIHQKVRAPKFYPAAFSLREQGLFCIGYYHQRHDLRFKEAQPDEQRDEPKSEHS